MNRIIKVLFTVLLIKGFVLAQKPVVVFETDSIRGLLADQAQIDSLNPKSPLWLPIIEIIGLNLALGTFNRYATKSEFAYISFETIKENFNHGFGWDADAFVTNMFAHPFHGSIYYNLARSSGYNYWQSLGMAAFGSWQWEFFMENEPPAINDWIQTSMGGSMLGELFYRLSSLIIDESAHGWNRAWREISVALFNPGRAFNRLIHGRTCRHNTLKLYEKEPHYGEIALGMNNVADGTNFEAGASNLLMTFDYIYGQPFVTKRRKPFDFFRLNVGVNFWDQPILGFLDSYGLLFGRNVTYQKRHKFLVGIFQHFDYMNNNVYEVGGTSIGGGVLYRFPKVREAELVNSLHLGVILMGGSNSIYAKEFEVAPLDSARGYNMGMGAHGKIEAQLRFRWGNLYIGYYLFWIRTLDGAPGDEFIGVVKPKLRLYLSKKWSIGFEYLLYYRDGIYDDFPNISSQNNEQRLFIGYRF
jgi:hypothetical protein